MKPKAHWKPLIKSFADEVSVRASTVDPDDEHDWHSLTIGWALAKGLAPEDANLFATFVCYNTDLA